MKRGLALYVKECIEMVDPETKRIAKRKKLNTFKMERCLNLIHPNKLSEEPTDEQRQNFTAWLEKSFSSTKTKQNFIDFLKPLKLHLRYIDQQVDVDQHVETMQLYDKFKKRLVQNGVKRKTHYGSFITTLENLSHLSNIKDVSQCGDVSLVDAVNFCLGNRKKGANMWYHLLAITGCKHSQADVDAGIIASMKIKKRFGEVCKAYEGSHTNIKLSNYKKLIAVFGETYTNLVTMPNDEIFQIFMRTKNSDTRGQQYRLLAAELKLLNRSDALEYMNMLLPFKVTGIAGITRIQQLSPWHKKLVDDSVEECMRVLSRRTHFQHTLRSHIGSRLSTQLDFIDEYTTLKYKTQMGTESNAIKWFFDNCDVKMVQDCIIEFVKTRDIRNHTVKSANARHYAESPVQKMMTHFKGPWRSYIKCGDTIDAVTHAKIICHLPDKRESADSMKRRTYTDDEIDALMDVAEDSCQRLIITLLREIGLRNSGLRHIKYHMLVGEGCIPKDICKVPEKAKSYREFVTSMNLKARIKAYVDYIKSNGIEIFDQMYIFHIQDPTTPPESHLIGNMLNKLSKRAGIEIHVHAHAFRHTIVGKLIEVGNSMEVVSKFIGHKNSAITEKNYWVTNIKELNQQMNNPFTGTYQTKQSIIENETKDSELYRAKTHKCMDIIHTYNKLISQCLDEDLNIHELQTKLFESMPNLGEVLITLNESINGSCTNSTMTSALTKPDAEHFNEQEKSDGEDGDCANMNDFDDIYETNTD
jgi:site-specific recombinase XerD